LTQGGESAGWPLIYNLGSIDVMLPSWMKRDVIEAIIMLFGLDRDLA
jgi:hypothetical protein